jgi:predicted HAD superfamily Cof-like phosphohydrolase
MKAKCDACGLNKPYEQVKEFHIVFGHPVAKVPTAMDKRRRKDRAGWIEEETEEFLKAETLVDQCDAITDILYFALGTMVELGIEPANLFDIVQRANMSKLFPDGKPHYRVTDGKVQKPPTWQPPEPFLEAEIQRQIDLKKE